MPQNDFLPWSIGTGNNAMPQSTYQSSPAVALGVGAGLADPTLANKTWRQASVVAWAMAQFIVDTLGIDVFDDGNVNTFLANFKNSIRGLGPLSWSANSPPAADILLSAGSSANITFTNLASIPLSISTAPNGIYRIILIVWATNQTNADWFLLPNNASYSGAFFNYAIELMDSIFTAFGGSTPPTTAVITSGNIGNFPLGVGQMAWAGPAPGTTTYNSFGFDMFFGPTNSNNDNGPFMLEILASTITAAKFCKGSSMIKGGPAVQGSIWNDTATGWTSLGTLQCPNATQSTGVVRVERIA